MAMKLHFKNGAIVRFTLACDSNINACGKVVEVNEDEVVFIPQEYVSETDYEQNWGTSRLNRKISVDDATEMHLARNIIVMWHYEPVPCNSRTIYYGVWQPSEIVQRQISVNKYDDDGLCKGHGDFFE